MEYLPQVTVKVQDQIDGAIRVMDLKHKVCQSVYVDAGFKNWRYETIEI